jgi:hypothetical protein
VRRLPPRLARIIIIVDMALGAFPLWAYFFYCRWTGRLLGPREFLRHYVRGIQYTWAHAVHNAAGVKTGAFYVDWRTPPVRRTLGVERADWSSKGACGTCQKCCSTVWRPEGKRATCPFLGERGCTIYGGVYWDYFNCGRYPVEPLHVSYYECPRFVGVFDKPVAPRKLPVLVQSSPAIPAAAAPSKH